MIGAKKLTEWGWSVAKEVGGLGVGLRKQLVSEHWEESTPSTLKQKIQTNKQTNKQSAKSLCSFILSTLCVIIFEGQSDRLGQDEIVKCSLHLILVSDY